MVLYCSFVGNMYGTVVCSNMRMTNELEEIVALHLNQNNDEFLFALKSTVPNMTRKWSVFMFASYVLLSHSFQF